MKFDPNEDLVITPELWAKAKQHQAETSNLTFPRLKGTAIDIAVKHMFGQSGGRFDPIDIVLEDVEIKHHEIKSTCGGNHISFPPREKERADKKLREGEDTLVWIFDQGKQPNIYNLLCLVCYSKLKMHRSQFLSWVLEEGEWVETLSWYFFRQTALRNAESL